LSAFLVDREQDRIEFRFHAIVTFLRLGGADVQQQREACDLPQ